MSRRGPDHCRGVWYVNEIEGGNQEVGLISRCGVYDATGWPHRLPYKVTVTGTQYGIGSCADCCPIESIDLTIVE